MIDPWGRIGTSRDVERCARWRRYRASSARARGRRGGRKRARSV